MASSLSEARWFAGAFTLCGLAMAAHPNALWLLPGLLIGTLVAARKPSLRLAGLSDAILLEVARQRAAGRPVLAGASLANLKNAGVRELTLLELVRRGVPDSQAAAIIAFRRHGATDAQIISHFAAL